MKSRQPFRKLVRRENPPHHVRFAEAGRKKIFARRLVGERAILVREKKLLRRIGRQFRKPFVAADPRVIEHQPERESRLVMFPDPDRMRKFRQPGRQSLQRRLFERAQVGGEFAGQRIVPLAQFRRQLEQPGQTVGPLESWPGPFPSGRRLPL